MPTFVRRPKDFLTGVLFLTIAVTFSFGLRDLAIGTAVRMGPGYFPVMLSIILSLFGIVLIVKGCRGVREPIDSVSWRGGFFVLASILFFAVTLERVGIVLSLAASVFIVTLADKDWKLLRSLMTSAIVVCGVVGIFVFLLGMQTPLFGR